MPEPRHRHDFRVHVLRADSRAHGYCRRLLQGATVVLAGMLPVAARAPDESVDSTPPPNIVIFMADDLGIGDVSYLGGDPQTPSIDQLAQGGVRLNNFHAFPACSPSRAALLTGRSPLRAGLGWAPIPPWSQSGLPDAQLTLADVLKTTGYFTALVGKWHLGHSAPSQHPNRHGFDHFHGCLNGAISYFARRSRRGGLDWQRNGVSVRDEGYVTEMIADEAERVVSAHDFATPLFLFVSFTAPHTPLHITPNEHPEYETIEDASRRKFCGMVSEMDAAVGRVVQALEEQQQSGNTVIVFLSDNGGALDDGGDNGGYRGSKNTVFEGGLRVPALIHWPDALQLGGQVDEVTSILDLAPTLSAAAGADLSLVEWDGRNLLPYLLEDEPRAIPRSPDSSIYVSSNEECAQVAVFKSDWKYIQRTRLDGSIKEWLFRLSEDPEERNNLAEERGKRMKIMRKELRIWLRLDPRAADLQSVASLRESEPEGWEAPLDWAASIQPPVPLEQAEPSER